MKQTPKICKIMLNPYAWDSFHLFSVYSGTLCILPSCIRCHILPEIISIFLCFELVSNRKLGTWFIYIWPSFVIRQWWCIGGHARGGGSCDSPNKIVGLGDCKSNSPNNPKTAIGTSPNTSYWERIIGRLVEMLLMLSRIGVNRSAQCQVEFMA